jgi:D-alanyl-D-alanine carboxypeptidase/D-alanyl-D-alanine-endopeptidase (penicillin-binding protein 4)
LTKIATSLAALKTWGPSYQFETLISATGPVQNGVLQGDLVIKAVAIRFVWEEAIALVTDLTSWVSTVSLAI